MEKSEKSTMLNADKVLLRLSNIHKQTLQLKLTLKNSGKVFTALDFLLGLQTLVNLRKRAIGDATDPKTQYIRVARSSKDIVQYSQPTSLNENILLGEEIELSIDDQSVKSRNDLYQLYLLYKEGLQSSELFQRELQRIIILSLEIPIHEEFVLYIQGNKIKFPTTFSHLPANALKSIETPTLEAWQRIQSIVQLDNAKASAARKDLLSEKSSEKSKEDQIMQGNHSQETTPTMNPMDFLVQSGFTPRIVNWKHTQGTLFVTIRAPCDITWILYSIMNDSEIQFEVSQLSQSNSQKPERSNKSEKKKLEINKVMKKRKQSKQ